MTIENKDWANWTEAMAIEYVENPSQEGRNRRVTRIRAGHADLPGTMKYGFDDVRNSLERASARETAARVAAGAIAMRLLEEFGIVMRSHVVAIGPISAQIPGRHRLGRRGGVPGPLLRPRGLRADDDRD